MKYELPRELRVDAEGAVRLVTLDRPEARNAFNSDMHRGFAALWPQLAADHEARVVVLTGAGASFSAGGDLDFIERSADDASVRHDAIRNTEAMIRSMTACALPVIGAMNGPAVGLGCSLILLCDLVIMADDAFIADPHVSVGLVAADGGAVVWPLLTSLLKAKEFLFTGDHIRAPDAERMGLANHVVPAPEVREHALALARRLAAQPPFGLQQTKRALNRHLERALSDVLPFALAAQSEAQTLPEVRQRVDELRRRPGRK